MNNHGVVCGEARRADLSLHAFRFDIATQTIEELAFDPAVDRSTFAYGLNDRGDVAGFSSRHDNFGQALLWTAAGEVIRFPYQVFGEQFAYDSAEHVNNYGDVVGHVLSARPEPPIGWVAHGVTSGVGAPAKIDLRTALRPADRDAWLRLHPFEINDRGQICGIGVVNGATRAFLMTPCLADGDVTFDGRVGVADVVAVLAGWGGAGRREDCTRDGRVDVVDLLCVLANWGAPPPC